MIKIVKQSYLLLLLLTIFISCSKDTGTNLKEEIEPLLMVENELLSTGLCFSYIKNNSISAPQSFLVNRQNSTSEINLSVSNNFKLSLNNVEYSNTVTMLTNTENNTIYVRFEPVDVRGEVSETLKISSDDMEDININLIGKAGSSNLINYVTFNKERVANGGGYKQTSVKTFKLHNKVSNIKTIKMYVKLTCPDGGCDEWDVFANVKVKDPISGAYFEMGRFITPYWNDNSQLQRGFEFDVTDFKSILLNDVELRIRTECWNTKGYEVTVDFDYIEGTPDYIYYEIANVLNDDNGSAAGIPYGISHNKTLIKQITIPNNTESTHLRTFINGWGEAYPADVDGKRCAEWCFRTHHIKINNVARFEHYLGPLGCANNPVSNQSPGNWKPDRAGWCPGMEVPTRINQFENAMAGNTFTFEYSLEDWVSNETKEAYYPISTFVVVKSNSIISRPIVVD